jgi:beta-ribofuranosylaminobenzene 5'-phosphate synthase
LHFGLWSLAGGPGRQFGGVGVMVARPGLALAIHAAPKFAATGPLTDRSTLFAQTWAEFHGHDLPACRLEIIAVPPQHAGLGTGTQLGLAVAAGLNAFVGLPSQSPAELAQSVGRGLRSAVGTYGFVQGGLIVEQGKLPGEPISPLDCRIDMPSQWRFLLVRPTELSGLAGDDEATAIAGLPAIPAAVTEQLVAEVRDHLVPAAATGDFPSFAKSLFRYGHQAGQCFAARQGGPYNGPILTRMVGQIRDLGAEGVGQSSWGPTLFVVQPSQFAAEQLVARLRETTDAALLDIVITPPANRGACIEVTHVRANGEEH